MAETGSDVADGLALHPNEVAKYVEQLLAEAQIVQTAAAQERSYRVVS